MPCHIEQSTTKAEHKNKKRSNNRETQKHRNTETQKHRNTETQKHKTLKALSTLVLTLCLTSTANATLISRLGGDALYDDVLDITWLSNANLALTNQFGLSLSTNAFDDTANTVGSTGRMTWDNANSWIAGMNSANHLGFNDWRLPTLSPINGTSFQTNLTNNGTSDLGYGATGIGWQDGSNTPVSEMGHLYYSTLGNLGVCTPNGSGSSTSCDTQTGFGLNNVGQFTNLQSNPYWSGLESPNPAGAWSFGTDNGNQGADGKSGNFFALAVRPGDVAAVPVPAAVWLMGSALFGLAGFRRKRRVVPAHP